MRIFLEVKCGGIINFRRYTVMFSIGQAVSPDKITRCFMWV